MSCFLSCFFICCVDVLIVVCNMQVGGQNDIREQLESGPLFVDNANLVLFLNMRLLCVHTICSCDGALLRAHSYRFANGVQALTTVQLFPPQQKMKSALWMLRD